MSLPGCIGTEEGQDIALLRRLLKTQPNTQNGRMHRLARRRYGVYDIGLQQWLLASGGRRSGQGQDDVHLPPWVVSVFVHALRVEERTCDIPTRSRYYPLDGKWKTALVYIDDVITYSKLWRNTSGTCGKY